MCKNSYRKMNKLNSLKTAFAVIAYVAALVCALVLPQQKKFYVDENKASLMGAVKDYIEEDTGITPEFVSSATVGKQIVIIFQDRTQENLLGAVLFQKGLNGRYRPVNMEYGMDSLVGSISTRSLPSDPKSRTVFYAASLPKEICSMEILNHSLWNLQGKFIPKCITPVEIKDPPFVSVYKKSGFRDFRLLDGEGNTVSHALSPNENPDYTHTATTLILDLSLLLIILFSPNFTHGLFYAERL